MACKVHRVSFYNPKPLAVNSLALNSSENWLAISREDASIEIWDMKHSPFLLKSIPGFEKGSVEALCWVGRRLISTGLGGALVEWDLESLTSKWSVLLTGYAAWCLDANSAETMVAVGTEQGYLNLLRVQPEQFVHEKLFDKQEGRIICCKFHKLGLILVTGSVNTIRIWDVSSGQALHRLQTRRRGNDNMVWRLAVLSDMTIVAGDSEGRLTFWDGNVAEQIESFATHRADVLSLVVSEDETVLYCSGIDPTIVSFSKVEVLSKSDGTKRMQWVKGIQRNVHEHDVRVLALKDDGTLISLGADGYMALSRYPPKWLMRIPPLPPAPLIATATVLSSNATIKHKLLLLRYSNHLEVWKLGRYRTDEVGAPIVHNIEEETYEKSPSKTAILEEESNQHVHNIRKGSAKKLLRLEENPLKLVTIRSKRNRHIKCCTISPDGQYILYSTDENIRMFHLEISDEEDCGAYLGKVSMCAAAAAAELHTCSRAHFTRDSSYLLVHAPGYIAALHINTNREVSLHQRISTAPYLRGSSILHLESVTTEEGRMYVTCADAEGGVCVWRREGDGEGEGKLVHHATLPRYRCVPAAIALDRRGHNLLLVYVDNTIVEYDLRQHCFNSWPEVGLPRAWCARKTAATGALYHPRDSNAFILFDHTAVCLIRKNTHLEEDDAEPVTKKKNKKNENLKATIFPFKYLAGWSWLGGSEAVAVEVPPESIISQLPPVLATKRFPAL